MKKLFLLLALLGIVATGCSKDEEGNIPDDAYISLNKEIVTISPDGESVDVKVYSNYAWELTNNCDWITTSITSGDASDTGVTVTLTADLTYDDRDGTIVFSCGKAKKLLVVSQKLKEVIIPDANNTFDIPAEGGVAVITYQTNVDCEVIIPEEAQDWITIAPAARGLVSESITLNITENTTYRTRTAVVNVVSKDNNKLSAEYTIIQNSKYCLYYTSSNGEIVQPNNSSAFGETIISNTYIDGLGVIEFDIPITTIGDEAFRHCESLTSVTIPDSVTTIGEWAFAECSSLTNVTIPDSVTEIGVTAFWNCDSLTSVTIPDSVTTIGDYAFAYCDSLTSITIPDSVTEIGDSAFEDCISLTSVTIPDSVTSIGNNAFWNCDSLTGVTIPNSVTTIGDEAFAFCNSLTSVTIGDSVTTIGYYAFGGCSSLQEFNGKFASDDGRCLIIDRVLNSFAPAGLTEYTIPDSVITIGERAFYYFDSLTSATIPDSVTEIGGWAFAYCSSLTSVTIGDSVTTIGYEAFYYCSSLTSVTIPDSVTKIGNEAFWGCSSLQEFNGKFASEDGRCLIIDGTLNSFAPAGLTEYTIPDSVTEIGYGAFYYCNSLTSVTIPDSVTTIGYYAFQSCSSLTSVTIPDSVTTIEDHAFYDCDSLTSVTIPDSVTTIGNSAFSCCSSLTSVTIPDSVTTIGYYAFAYCNSLTSVTIPNSVTEIGGWAFAYCSSLTSVYCKTITPPVGGYEMFSYNASGRKIYVPMESVEAYKSAGGWSGYASDIVGYNF